MSDYEKNDDDINAEEFVDEALNEGDKKRSVSKLEGIVLRQLESALKGNDKAALATLKMAAQVGLLDVGDIEMESPHLSAGEQQIIDELLSNKTK